MRTATEAGVADRVDPRRNEELRRRVNELRGDPWNWSYRRIAAELGVSIARAFQLLNDPEEPVAWQCSDCGHTMRVRLRPRRCGPRAGGCGSHYAKWIRLDPAA